MSTTPEMRTTTVPIKQDVRARQNADAERFRQELDRRGILCVNMISSPGSGKTALLEATAKHWNGRIRMGVLVGDLATNRDADRLSPYVPARQLTTGGACHLEIDLVKRGWQEIEREPLDVLIIENVGNLVCPSSFYLGEHLRVVLLSVTEGDDKPGKYPKAFRTSDVCILSKTDLLPYLPFSVEAAMQDAHRIRPDQEIRTVSSLTGAGISDWCDLLESRRNHILRQNLDTPIATT